MHCGAVAAVAARRLDGVVEAQHGRRRPAAQDRPAGLDAVGERRRTCTPPAAPSAGSGWARSHTLVIDAERALGAEEQLGEVGPDGAGRRAAGAHDRAVGEHDLEADDEVLDLAVAGGVLAGAAAGDPAADGGDVEALREVADADSPWRCLQLVLEVGPERAGEHLDDARRGVDVADAGQRR